jgi:hypothetical protein
MEELEIFLSSDQPTTCPKCGNRTEIIGDLTIVQDPRCLSKDCGFKFILEFDYDNEL